MKFNALKTAFAAMLLACTASTAMAKIAPPSGDGDGASSGSSSSQPPAPTGHAPVYYYANVFNGDHLYTTNVFELGVGGNGWVYTGIVGYASTTQTVGTQPVFRYYSPYWHDHLYTTTFSELGAGNGDYRLEGVAFYLPTAAASDTQPWYRYRKVDGNQHFYDTQSLIGTHIVYTQNGAGTVATTVVDFMQEGAISQIWNTP